MQYRAMSWDDLRIVLALSRSGSAIRAAGLLGVNQTTVLRRLDRLEAELGVRLFDRRNSGLQATGLGECVIATADMVEREILALCTHLAAHQRNLAGAVRLTTSETLAGRLVTPCLRAFHAVHPNIVVELITSDERLDIARGEADVALRANSRPEGAGIVARRLPDAEWTVYCSRAYAAERGAPRCRAEIPAHDIVGMEGRMAQLPGWIWLRESAPDTIVRFRSNSLINLVSNLRAGLGVGALPVIIGDAEPDLTRCFDPPLELRAEMWLIVREDLKDQRHVRAFTEFLAGYIRATLAEPAARP
jgi:DNA-binding transcriptional LysR family regulator